MPTKIDYLTDTWSPISGCSGKGCKAHCWAKDMVRRFSHLHGYLTSNPDERVDFSKPHFHPNRLEAPLHWRKPRRVGVCYMGDWMDDQVQCHWIDQILEVIAACPQHQFFTLTKQPQNLDQKIYGHCPNSPARELGGGDYLPNLWLGVSVTDQEDADRMIPKLLKVPGKKWVSIEPMLGPVNLELAQCNCPWPADAIQTRHLLSCPADRRRPGRSRKWDIDWVVLGAESGPKRRPCPHDWMIDVVKQCKAAGVPVWVKQMVINRRVSHNPDEWPEELRARELP